MRIEVDFNVCADHHQCTSIAPDVFRVDDNGYLAFTAEPAQELHAAARNAADGCPEQAITIVD
jgi:ferredoxin